MPPTNATEDAAFVTEVTQALQDACVVMQQHNATMLEEYLRRRAAQAETTLAEHLNEQQVRMREAQAALEAQLARSASALKRTQSQVKRAAEVLAWAHVRHIALQCFQVWRRHTERSAVVHRMASQLASQNKERLLARFYSRWLLHTYRCHAANDQKKAQQNSRTREAALLAKLESVERELVLQRRRGGDVEAQLRLGFIRGVSALNREAVRTLRGPNADETKVAEIEDILTKEDIGDGGGVDETRAGRRVTPGSTTASGSHSAAPPRCPGSVVAAAAGAPGVGNKNSSGRHTVSRTTLLSADEAVSLADGASNICPVHHTDAEGNFYHRCYAPGVCRCAQLGDRRCGIQVTAAHVPFVVCPDTKLARRYDAGPPLKMGPHSGSSRMRR